MTPTISLGTRSAVFGRSGSGKTYLVKWMMLRSKHRWVVLDTKHDPGFDEWQPRAGFQGAKAIAAWWQDHRIMVVRPKPHEMKPVFLDAYLGDLHDSFDGFGTCIDETYHVAFGPKAGPGLTGLVTRGRARRQAVIMGSQRPAWVPRFVMSEANNFAVMSLSLMDDRKTVYSFVARDVVLQTVKPRHWLYYDVADDKLTRYGPVTILAAPSTPAGSPA